MTDSERPSPSLPNDDQDEIAPGASLPHDLPPVEPPSAGMIVQLFLIPAVIVAAIVGVYALFGRLATQEMDWRQLVTDVRSENPHVRWRGALGLAQMLDAEGVREPSERQYVDNREIASALSELYHQLAVVTSPNEEQLKQIEFLSKAMGRTQVVDIVVPAFRSGMQPGQDQEVRKHSLTGLAMIAGTLREGGKTFSDPKMIDELITISQESDPLYRHQAAYILGLSDSTAADDRLKVLLDDADEMTRINAAIGLARKNSIAGAKVFHEILQEGADWKLNPSDVVSTTDEETYFERRLMLQNTIRAVNLLRAELDDEQKRRFADELQTLFEHTQDSSLRSVALEVLQQIQNED